MIGQKTVKKNDTIKPREQFRLEYWTAFNEYAFANAQYAKTFNKRKATTDHWMDLSIGSSGCHIAMNLVKKDSNLVVELYISDDKELFRSLLSRKGLIENEIGCALDWRELPEKKASRILLAHHVDFEDRQAWKSQFEWLMDTTMKYKKAFKKYI